MRKFVILIPVLFSAGCITTPPLDNPLFISYEAKHIENPVLIAPPVVNPGGPGQPPLKTSYSDVFESVLNVLEDYFPIDYANRYDGRIVCRPTTAHGFEQFWKLGSPDTYQRVLATFQSMRFRCIVQITAAENGGYRVQVTVFRELEDLPQPVVSQNVSVFRDAASVDRVFQILDPNIPPEGHWIPMGRDIALEDALLKKLRRCQPE